MYCGLLSCHSLYPCGFKTHYFFVIASVGFRSELSHVCAQSVVFDWRSQQPLFRNNHYPLRELKTTACFLNRPFLHVVSSLSLADTHLSLQAQPKFKKSVKISLLSLPLSLKNRSPLFLFSQKPCITFIT